MINVLLAQIDNYQDVNVFLGSMKLEKMPANLVQDFVKLVK